MMMLPPCCTRPVNGQCAMPCGARPYLSHAPRAKSNNRRVVCANATSTTKSNVPLRGDPYELIADTTVFRVADEGASVRLGDLWQPTQAAVVFWARSMGCPFCWELSIRLHQDIIPRLGQNIPLYLVSIGTAQRGLDFVAKTGFPAERLLADPISSTYAALGLKKGVVDTFFNPQTPLALATRAARGELGVLQSQVLPQWEPWQPPKQDQALQQGGVVVFAGHQGSWAHFDPATSVHADLDEVVDEAQRAQRALLAMQPQSP